MYGPSIYGAGFQPYGGFVPQVHAQPQYHHHHHHHHHGGYPQQASFVPPSYGAGPTMMRGMAPYGYQPQAQQQPFYYPQAQGMRAPAYGPPQGFHSGCGSLRPSMSYHGSGFGHPFAAPRGLYGSQSAYPSKAVPMNMASGAPPASAAASEEKIFRSPLPALQLNDNISFTDYVLNACDKYGNAEALVDSQDGRKYTFNQLRPLVRKVASGLAKRGFKQGDCLAIFSPNLPEYFFILHAVLTLGGTVTSCNPLYTADELRHQLSDARASFIITVPPFLPKVNEAKKGHKLREVFVFGPATEGATPFQSLIDKDDSGVPKNVRINPKKDVACLPYSSGTTGLPKGVMLTHASIVQNLQQFTAPSLIEFQPGDSVMAVLPFFHIYGLMVVLHGGLIQGARIVCAMKFDPQTFVDVIRKYDVTLCPVAPPLVNFMVKHPSCTKENLPKLKCVFSGAAPLGGELAEMCVKKLGCDLRQGYGLTELSPVSHVSPVGSKNYGSVGILIPNTELKLVDPETNKSVGVEQRGEIWIRGPQVMLGYLNNKAATDHCIDSQGWFHTGDIGYVDKDGQYYIVDRLKELIKVKGFQVAPAELEATLQTHPAVADAACIPIPHERHGEVPKAFVVLKPNTKATAEEIIEFCAKNHAEYKRIYELEFMDAIPKSASGKILRRTLKDREKSKKK